MISLELLFYSIPEKSAEKLENIQIQTGKTVECKITGVYFNNDEFWIRVEERDWKNDNSNGWILMAI